MEIGSITETVARDRQLLPSEYWGKAHGDTVYGHSDFEESMEAVPLWYLQCCQKTQFSYFECLSTHEGGSLPLAERDKPVFKQKRAAVLPVVAEFEKFKYIITGSAP